MRSSGGVRPTGMRVARLGATALSAVALVAGLTMPSSADQAEESSSSTDSGLGAQTPSDPGTGFNPNGGFGGAAQFVPVPADPSVVPAPPVNENLPEQVDVKGPFEQQISCDPNDRPGVTAFALLVTSHYGRPVFSGARPCIDYASFHHDGRALDWPLNAFDAQDRQIADAVIVWLTDNDGEMAKRFGIEYLIWNGLIWNNNTGAWSVYTGSAHTDHIHFSFTWDGALMRTSWWTGVAVTQPDLGPCDVTPWQYAALHQVPRLEACDAVQASVPSTGYGRVRPGESGPGVAMLQERLGLEATGVLDTRTREALVDWQAEQGIPATGVADDYSYATALGWEIGDLPDAALAVPRAEWQTSDFTPFLRTTVTEGDEGEAVKVLQRALGAEPDGSFGPKTAAALAEWEQTVPVLAAQAERRGDGPAVVTPLTWVLLERATHPTMAVRDVTLRNGSLDIEADPDGALAQKATLEGRAGTPYSGGAVGLLQRLLGLEDDGSFGPKTEAAVIEVQQEAGLEPTGEVDGPTWAAVEAVAIREGTVVLAPGAAEVAEKAAEQAKEEKFAKELAAAKKEAAAELAAQEAPEREVERRAQEAQERARQQHVRALQGVS